MTTLQQLKLPQLRALAESLEITKDKVAGDARKPQSWIDAIIYHEQKEAYTSEEVKAQIKDWIFCRYELEFIRSNWGDYFFRDELFCTIKKHFLSFPRFIESRFDDGWVLFIGYLESKLNTDTLFDLDAYTTAPKIKNTWADAADVEDDDELLPLRSPSRAVPTPEPEVPSLPTLEPEVPSLPSPEPEVPSPETDDDSAWDLDTFLPVDVAASRFNIGDKVCVFHGTAAYRAGQIIDFRTCNRTPKMPLVLCDDGIERFLPPQMMKLLPEGQLMLFPLDEFDITIAQMEAEFDEDDDRDRDIRTKFFPPVPEPEIVNSDDEDEYWLISDYLNADEVVELPECDRNIEITIPPGYPEPGTVDEEEYWWVDPDSIDADEVVEELPVANDRLPIAICDRDRANSPVLTQFWLTTYQGWIDSFDTNVAICNKFMDEFSYSDREFSYSICDRAGKSHALAKYCLTYKAPKLPANHSIICKCKTIFHTHPCTKQGYFIPLTNSMASRSPP